MELKDKEVLVVGLGQSGLNASRLLAQKGASVSISEQRPWDDVKSFAERLAELPIKHIETGGHREETFLKADLIVVSPGVPLNQEVFKRAKAKGIPVIGELELGYQFCPWPIFAVTGTNGKTTTVSLLFHLLKEAGKRVVLAGNNFEPLSEVILSHDEAEVVVMEVSSFQLETIKTFSPKAAVLLNITHDHCERHGSLHGYALIKRRLFENQDEEDFAVLNADDPVVMEACSGVSSSILLFSLGKEVEQGVFLKNKKVLRRHQGREEALLETSAIRLKGDHNLSNVMAVLGATLPLNLPADLFPRAIGSFKGLEHRIEEVREKDGVLFINDSKATNIDAMEKAILAVSRPIVLLAGGRGKGSDYSLLRPLLREKVKALILLGEDAEIMKRAWSDLMPTHVVGSLREGVRLSETLAQQGDAVLLSPCCASFDMFTSFEERGRVFKDEVLKL